MWQFALDKNNIYTSNEECQELLSKCPSLHMPNYFIFLFGLGKHIQIILYIIKNFIQMIFNSDRYGMRCNPDRYGMRCNPDRYGMRCNPDRYGMRCNPDRYGMRWVPEICTLPDGEESILDWAFPPNAESGLDSSDAKTPILMIHPGALGNRKTLMGQWVKKAHSRGWIVCVHNRRGHGQLLTLPKWNFFGSVEDVEYITTNYILKRRPNAILIKLGISAGSGLVIKCFVKNTQFVAGVCISPGIGIKKSMGRPEQPYNSFIVNGMKNFLQQNKHILQNIIGYKECMNAKNPQEFTDNCWAMAGYSSMEEYYKNECSMDAFINIKNPLLLINSADDPIAVKQNILDWKYLANYKCHKGMFVLTYGGSHCAFLEGIFIDSWSERVTFEYFDAIISSLK